MKKHLKQERFREKHGYFLVSNTPYWQIPMVASHEYGHHIFQTLTLDNTSSEIKHSGACFQNHTTMKNSIYKVQGGLRDNQNIFIFIF
jgi:hypothetical protein